MYLFAHPQDPLHERYGQGHEKRDLERSFRAGGRGRRTVRLVLVAVVLVIFVFLVVLLHVNYAQTRGDREMSESGRHRMGMNSIHEMRAIALPPLPLCTIKALVGRNSGTNGRLHGVLRDNHPPLDMRGSWR